MLNFSTLCPFFKDIRYLSIINSRIGRSAFHSIKRIRSFFYFRQMQEIFNILNESHYKLSYRLNIELN